MANIKEAIRAHLEKHSNNWKSAKKHIKELNDVIGWEPTQQECYDILNDIEESDRVAACGKPKIFTALSRGYQFCGTQKNCPCAKDYTTGKRKATCLDKYGVEHHIAAKEVRAKSVATLRKNYGVDVPAKSQTVLERMKETAQNTRDEHMDEILRKRKETIFERHGVYDINQIEGCKEKRRATVIERYGENGLWSDEIRKKRKETCIEKYGTDNPMKSKVVQQKAELTNIEKYGAPCVFQSEEIKDKITKTNIERFGAANPFANEDIKKKISETNLDRYGYKNPSYSSEIKNKISHSNLSNSYSDEVIAILENKDALEKFVGDKSFKTAAKELGVADWNIRKRWIKYGLERSKSSYETEIAEILREHDIAFIESNKKIITPYELDFYVESMDLGIEFNGIYWHSTAVRPDPMYHRKKYERAVENDVRLIMINEDEWNERNVAWTNRLINILGKSKRGPGARELNVRPITNTVANDFLSVYHIQGETRAMIYALGAFHDKQLVAVMAFGKQRGTQDVELVRFATDGMNYPGIFSKLFKNAIESQQYDKVISFADLRHSNGGVYINNGFILENTIPPDYRYVFRNQTKHKSSFTKTKIAEKFGVNIEGKTEKQLMEDLNIPRIYDCGKLKFVWRR